MGTTELANTCLLVFRHEHKTQVAGHHIEASVRVWQLLGVSSLVFDVGNAMFGSILRSCQPSHAAEQIKVNAGTLTYPKMAAQQYLYC